MTEYGDRSTINERTRKLIEARDAAKDIPDLVKRTRLDPVYLLLRCRELGIRYPTEGRYPYRPEIDGLADEGYSKTDIGIRAAEMISRKRPFTHQFIDHYLRATGTERDWEGKRKERLRMERSQADRSRRPSPIDERLALLAPHLEEPWVTGPARHYVLWLARKQPAQVEHTLSILQFAHYARESDVPYTHEDIARATGVNRRTVPAILRKADRAREDRANRA